MVCINIKKFERRCPSLTYSIEAQIERRCDTRRQLADLASIVKRGVNIAETVDLRTAAVFFAAKRVPIAIAVRVLSGGCRETDRSS